MWANSGLILPLRYQNIGPGSVPTTSTSCGHGCRAQTVHWARTTREQWEGQRCLKICFIVSSAFQITTAWHHQYVWTSHNSPWYFSQLAFNKHYWHTIRAHDQQYTLWVPFSRDSWSIISSAISSCLPPWLALQLFLTTTSADIRRETSLGICWETSLPLWNFQLDSTQVQGGGTCQSSSNTTLSEKEAMEFEYSWAKADKQSSNAYWGWTLVSSW